jgi:hypothetical protein
MIFKKAPIMKEVEDYVFKSSTYCNIDGSHPSIDTILNPNDILDGKISINSNISEEIKDKLKGQAYISSFYKDYIPIID